MAATRKISKISLLVISGLGILWLPLLNLTASIDTAAPNLVQSKIAYVSSFVNSYSVTFNSSVGNGNLVIVAISSWNPTNNASITSVTDSSGNTYARVLESLDANGDPLSIWYAQNVSGGSSLKVTANVTTGSTMTIAIHEYTGLATAGALDVSASSSNTGSSAGSGYTPRTAVANELIFGAFNYTDDLSSISVTAGSGYTIRQEQADNHTYESLFTEDTLVNTQGQYQSALGYSQSVHWRGAAAAFKAAGSSSTPTPAPTSTLTSSPTPTAAPAPTSTSTSSPTPTAAPTSTSTSTPSPTPAPSRTASPSPTQTPSPTPTPSGSVPLAYFKVGVGFADVIPHQIVRTGTDKVYLFAAAGVNSTAINVRWTAAPGVPASASSFSGSAVYNASGYPISVDAAYDGSGIIHVLANLVDGTLYDYPFDLTTNTFKSAHQISSGDPVRPDLYPGTAGVSAMIGLDGALNVAYWTNAATPTHITYASFVYNATTDTLAPQAAPFQVDTAGYASHPVLAVSPLDGSVTIAWLSEAATPHSVLARTKTSSRWDKVEQVSNPTVNVWTYTDPYAGTSADQGPSLVVTADGTKHLAYIEDTDATGNYGHVHYVHYGPATGWVDTALSFNGFPFYTHDPSLAPDSANNVYMLGHGNYLNNTPPCTSVDILCYVVRSSSGAWGTPALFATPPGGETFDASVSTKWSVVGWNRPELVEVVFFSGGTSNYWNMSLYYGTLGR